ncbi:hypothetical protein [Vibrio satsumensis]|uniref:hypothetical protein n=1 Tax=Vibrio satsumensis TaxID=2910245 RepID=UPI003D1468A7
MNKTILATLITTAFSSNVIAQSVDVELANLATEKAIQSQMDNIDAATLAKLNEQNNKVVELNGVVYEQDESGVWKAIGTGALGLTAALFSGSSSSSSNKLLDTPNYEQGAIKPSIDNKPGFPDVDNDIPRDINLITHGDTAYMYVNGEEVRTATLDVISKDNFTITGSEGATFHVTGDDVLITMVNGESVKLHNVNRTDERNISFSVEGENYNLHRTYSGEVWVQKEQGNGTGNWATVKTGADVLANIQERQLINAIDKTLPGVDNDIPRDINLITHGDTAYMYVNGEEVRTATLDVTSKDNFTITGSEGATFHVTGNDVLITMVNGESVKIHNVNRTDERNISFSVAGENYNLHRTYNGEVWVQKEQGNGTGHWATVKTGADVLASIQERQLINAIDKTTPDVDNDPIFPEISGDEGAQELKIVNGGIFFGGEKIGFIASDGNVNLYEHGKVGTAVYNGEGVLTAIKGNNGRELALRDDRITLVGDRGSVTMSRSDGSIRIDHNYDNTPSIDGDFNDNDRERPIGDKVPDYGQGPAGFQIEEKAGSYHILDAEGNKVGHVKKEDGNIIKDGVGVIGSVAQVDDTGVYSFYNKSGDFVGDYTPSNGEIGRPDSRNEIKSKLQSADKSKLRNIKSRIQARFTK